MCIFFCFCVFSFGRLFYFAHHFIHLFWFWDCHEKKKIKEYHTVEMKHENHSRKTQNKKKYAVVPSPASFIRVQAIARLWQDEKKFLSSFCLSSPIFNSKHNLWQNEHLPPRHATGVDLKEAWQKNEKKKSQLINFHFYPFSNSSQRQSKPKKRVNSERKKMMPMTILFYWRIVGVCFVFSV